MPEHAEMPSVPEPYVETDNLTGDAVKDEFFNDVIEYLGFSKDDRDQMFRAGLLEVETIEFPSARASGPSDDRCSFLVIANRRVAMVAEMRTNFNATEVMPALFLTPSIEASIRKSVKRQKRWTETRAR